MRFEQVFELLVQFPELGRDHVLAVRLVGVLGVIVPVVILGVVEILQRLYGGDDRAAERFRFVQFFDEGLRFTSFACRMVERCCVPTSLPWRLSVVGSWVAKNTVSRSRKPISAGSNSMRITSAWPVVPSQTSS